MSWQCYDDTNMAARSLVSIHFTLLVHSRPIDFLWVVLQVLCNSVHVRSNI